jgi:tellurite methyltransferase
MHDPQRLATAHQAWDERWQDPEKRAPWEQPEPFVEAIVPLLRSRDVRHVLDLGCGIGRHALYFATLGFTSVGVDGSKSAVAQARDRAAAAGLDIDYRVGSFYELDFADQSFGAVIAWNVIYHGDGSVARQAIEEIHRVLQPGGIYVASMLSKRNKDFGRGREIRPDTFVVDYAPDDKSHPHFYCDATTLLGVHAGFEIVELRDRQQAPGANHWEFVFERR